MKILYNPEKEFAVVIDTTEEARIVVGVAEILIREFGDDSDVSRSTERSAIRVSGSLTSFNIIIRARTRFWPRFTYGYFIVFLQT